MKKRAIVLVSIIIIIIIIGGIIYYKSKEKNNATNISIIDNEIIPEEEISDEQLRETTINLFFVNKNNEIISEVRKIDSKLLLKEPYKEAIKLLTNGPKTDDLKSYIPKNTKLNKIEKNGEILIIDFSKEFIEEQSENVEIHGLVISQIVDTMTQFTEINSVKILIDGEENKKFKNGNINFEQLFTKED